MGKVQQTDGPYWSKAWIQKIWEFTNQNFVDFDTGAVDFEALGREEYEFRKAMFFRNFKNSKRAEEAFKEAQEVYLKRVESGKSGGRPPNPTPEPERPRPRTPRPISLGRCPSSKEEFKEFVADNDLHPGLAEEWFDIHINRDWVDKNGEPIKNWKGAVTEYCKQKERRQNNETL